MARIVLVHGAFHELWGPYRLLFRWTPPLLDGLEAAGVDLSERTFQEVREEIAVAFWGDLFRPDGDPDAADDGGDAPAAAPDQIIETLGGPGGDSPGLDAIGAAISTGTHQRTLEALAAYFTDPDLRARVQGRVNACLGPETEVVIAHSMGTVIAYEVLATRDDLDIGMFVTLGSPLGAKGLIFDVLQPSPIDGQGVWPTGIRAWTNVAAERDLATMAAPRLAPAFGEGVTDRFVYNGRHPHDIEPYLTAKETGQAVAAGLTPRR
jgi:pimeloyl-ACP methyl ester carboxylesterase